MRDSVMVAASGAAIAPIDTADAHTPDFAAHQAALGAANSKPGPRIVPAKVIPVPEVSIPQRRRWWPCPTGRSGV
jgi:epsilon-lactone hydrolase